MQRPARKRAAATLDDLGGAAKKVAFVRDDARALASAAPSKSQLKAALAVPFDALPAPATGNVAEAVLSRLASDCVVGATAGADGRTVRAGVVLGLGAVTRALRQGRLSAVMLAREPQPMLVAHVAAVAAPCGVPVCVLPCGSAQLGQPFALLRAAAVGLRSAEFGEDHALVRAVERAGRSEGHGSGLQNS
jgi:ribosomal protein L7Ae-like RNA K-turn-binding protein